MVKALFKPMKGSICWTAYSNNIAKKTRKHRLSSFTTDFLTHSQV